VNFLTASGVLSLSGGVSLPIPSVPSTAKPVLSCYITNSLVQPVAWLPVSDGDPTNSSTSACGLVLSGGQWNAVMINGPSAWFYYMVVIW